MAGRLGIIGGGIMGQAIARGAITAHVLRPNEIIVSELDARKRTEIERLGCPTSDDARRAAECEQVLLAVKPQSFGDVAAPI
ncbi:MAG: NAD(P)-binding domain-containing protein, partial [Planctomycetota bacterium]